jgi:hypothetical protein
MTQETELHPNLLRACRIARGEEQGSLEPIGSRTFAYCDYSARGSRRAHWYAMVRDGNSWTYRGAPLRPVYRFAASTRHQSSKGPLYEGDVVVTHDHGGPLDKRAYLYWFDGERDREEHLEVKQLRDGRIRIALPDGTHIEAANPRGRVR